MSGSLFVRSELLSSEEVDKICGLIGSVLLRNVLLGPRVDGGMVFDAAGREGTHNDRWAKRRRRKWHNTYTLHYGLMEDV